MKTPTRLAALVDEGLIDEVIGQLMSGKEATVYVVRCGENIRCANFLLRLPPAVLEEPTQERDILWLASVA